MEKKIKVGVFVDNYFPTVDGVAVVVDNYARLLQKKGYEVFVAAPGKKYAKDDKKFPYKIIRSIEISSDSWAYSWPMPGYDAEFKKSILKEKPDIVHIHSPFGMGKEGVRLARKLNIPVVATMHSQFKQDFYKSTKSRTLTKMLLAKIMRVFNKCQEVFAMSNQLVEVLKDYGYTGQTRIIPNATDMKYPENAEALKEEINKKHNLKQEDIMFLFVGRLIDGKGILFLVDALKELKKKGQKFKMVFVGDGPDRELLEEKIKNQNMQKDIILTGKIMDRELLSAYYVRANLFLFPSVYDNDSLVQKEAGINKTPTVFCKGALTAHSVVDNKNGFLAQLNPLAYANRVYEILNDKKLLDKVTKTVYEEQLSWEDVVDKVSLAYDDVFKNYRIKQLALQQTKKTKKIVKFKSFATKKRFKKNKRK